MFCLEIEGVYIPISYTINIKDLKYKIISEKTKGT